MGCVFYALVVAAVSLLFLAKGMRLSQVEVGVVAELRRVKIKLAEVQQLGVGDIAHAQLRAETSWAVYSGAAPNYWHGRLCGQTASWQSNSPARCQDITCAAALI